MIYVLLGTNLGDREWNLDRARALLAEELKSDLICSDIIETESIGFEGPAFLNQVVAFQCSVSPEGLLDICQRIEKEIGRPEHDAEYDAEGRRIYRDRIIDIDILKFDDLEMNTPRLTIPHPQVVGRPFVTELLNTL
ncbi:MAG: 2-amino-4-hydroxy-6-hydroxymethyldihydropteridine diphosphokinase [Bacteroidales bacterium]|nr:2-amino-4-hydroxy-6-hydroxymethyldihydropteridine diphosphokinase [Candidatus Cacconaster merdequi]